MEKVGQATTDNSYAVNLDNEKTSIKHFDFLKYIGGGGFGKIYLVKKNRGSDFGRYYAVKVIQKAQIKCGKMVKRNINEREVLKRIRNCPFIMKMYYAFQSSKTLCLVLEYIPGSDMKLQMKYQNRKSFSENETRFYIAEIIVALEYLHQSGIIHRDLKLENILLDREGHIILTDFGMSKVFLPHEIRNGMTRTYSCCGTLNYMAPEIFASKVNNGYDFSVDWWAVGVLTYRLISGCMPFKRKGDNLALVKRRIICDYPALPDSSPELSSFISGLLVKNPYYRLGNTYGISEIKSHCFFENATPAFTWNALKNKQILPPLIPICQHNETDIANAEAFSYSEIETCADRISSNVGLNVDFKNYSYMASSILLADNRMKSE